nr:MAG TPA: hypothetical protein [Bacteriophage sp.]
MFYFYISTQYATYKGNTEMIILYNIIDIRVL